ncbi:MAG: DUF2180 family protein [Candidatus Dormibacteria bacterium]
MNCLDCARDHQLQRPAVAACSECGAGVCEQHLVVRPHHLIRNDVLFRQAPAHPPARRVRCRNCAAPWQAPDGYAGYRDLAAGTVAYRG